VNKLKAKVLKSMIYIPDNKVVNKNDLIEINDDKLIYDLSNKGLIKIEKGPINKKNLKKVSSDIDE